MRTTLRIADDLLAEARRIAAATGASLGAVIEDALREAFARRKESRRRGRVELPVGNGQLRPGVDLDNSGALLDLLEADE